MRTVLLSTKIELEGTKYNFVIEDQSYCNGNVLVNDDDSNG